LQYSAKSKDFIRSETVLSEELQRRSNCNQTMERNQKKTSEHLKMLRNLSPSEDAKKLWNESTGNSSLGATYQNRVAHKAVENCRLSCALETITKKQAL